ncbi:MAG: DNA polymerase III subunit delta [Alphaproteobacteria bacterium]
MKISPRDADAYLGHPQKTGGALLYGADAGQVRQRAEQLMQGWQGKNPDPLARSELSPEQLKEDPARLADELAAMSLMGGKRIILIREPADSLVPALSEALALRAPDNFLVITVGEALGAASKLRQWAEKSNDIACIAFYKDEGAGLAQFLRETLRGYGLKAGTEVTNYLATQLAGDRQIIVNEIEKLSLYLGDDATSVTLEEVMTVVGEHNDQSLEELAKAIAAGDVATVCRLTDRLLAEGHAGVVLVRAVMRYVDTLVRVSELRSAGMTVDAAIEQLFPRIAFKIKPAMRPHAMRWSEAKLADALAMLQRLELESKRHHDQSRIRLAQGFLTLATLPSPAKKAG